MFGPDQVRTMVIGPINDFQLVTSIKPTDDVIGTRNFGFSPHLCTTFQNFIRIGRTLIVPLTCMTSSLPFDAVTPTTWIA